MSTIYSVYAVEAASLDAARAAVEAALGVELALHDSSYYGDYYAASGDQGEVEVHANYHPAEDAWLEDAHRDAAYVLRLTSPAGAGDWNDRLAHRPRLRLLRSSRL